MKYEDQPHANRKKRPLLLKNHNPQGDPSAAPRCGAKTRKGPPCRGPAMKNGRCRMHGGKSTGPRTLQGLERSRKANWKHGYHSRRAIGERKLMQQFMKGCKEFLEERN